MSIVVRGISGAHGCWQNVRDHRWLQLARLLPGDERAQAGGVTRLAIRWIALFGYFIDTLAYRAQQLVGGLRP